MEHPRLFRFLTLVIRFLQFTSATIIMGMAGYLLGTADAKSWDLGRLIWTECVAAVTVVFLVVVFLPSIKTVVVGSIDILLSVLWWSVFGLLFNFLIFNPADVLISDHQNDQLTTCTAFAFVAGVLFLLSGIFNCLIDTRQPDAEAEEDRRKDSC